MAFACGNAESLCFMRHARAGLEAPLVQKMLDDGSSESIIGAAAGNSISVNILSRTHKRSLSRSVSTHNRQVFSLLLQQPMLFWRHYSDSDKAFSTTVTSFPDSYMNPRSLYEHLKFRNPCSFKDQVT